VSYLSKFSNQRYPGPPPRPRTSWPTHERRSELLRSGSAVAADPETHEITDRTQRKCIYCRRRTSALAAVGTYILGRPQAGEPLIGSCSIECATLYLSEWHSVMAWQRPDREPGRAELEEHHLVLGRMVAALTLGLLDEGAPIQIEAAHWPPGVRTTLYSPRLTDGAP
jgi:hypothetical protein